MRVSSRGNIGPDHTTFHHACLFKVLLGMVLLSPLYSCTSCRGLIPITILKHIETICGQPIHKLFDFVCGTSTGSVLAVLLCLRKFTAQECKEYYREFSTEVFKMNNLLGISHFFLNHAFYDARLLEKVLRLAAHTYLKVMGIL